MTITIPQILFYVFSVLAIASAAMVIVARNPVRAVLFLVATFIAMAGVWLLAQAEFLAWILILVYVGAVMTLFLFVVMMMDLDRFQPAKLLLKHAPIGLLIVALLVALVWIAIKPENFDLLSSMNSRPLDFNDTKALGLILYTNYALAFELAAVLLLIAIVAAITLAHRGPRHCKIQDVPQQLQVRREDRLRIIKMKPETGE